MGRSFVKDVHCPIKSLIDGIDCTVKNRGKVLIYTLNKTIFHWA